MASSKAVKQKSKALVSEETPLSIAKPSGEFDLNKFKARRAVAAANIETLPTSLPVHNMAAAKDFVRLHPDGGELLVGLSSVS